MLGLPLRYFLKHPVTTVAYLAADPLQIWMTVQDEYAAEREGSRPKHQYESDTIGNSDFMSLWASHGRARRHRSSGRSGPT